MIPFNIDFSGQRIDRVLSSADVFLIHDYYLQQKGSLLVIANNNQEADNLYLILEEMLGKEEVNFCPDWETLAYEQSNPAPIIVSERITFFQKLGASMPGIYIISLTSAMHKMAPVNYLIKTTNYHVGEEKSLKDIKENLIVSGYREVEVVYEPGEFAAISSYLDFFPIGAENPYRINFFDGEIHRIRKFDTESQSIIEDVDSIEIKPGAEFPQDEAGCRVFLEQFAEYFGRVDVSKNSIYGLIADGIIAQGAQYYLPLFFKQPLSTLADFISAKVKVINYDSYEKVSSSFLAENKHRYKERKNNTEWPPVAVEDLYIQAQELFKLIEEKTNILTFSRSIGNSDYNYQQASAFNPLENLTTSYLNNNIGKKYDQDTEDKDRKNNQEEISLGFDREGNPIRGSLTKNFSKKSSLTKLFCPQIKADHQLFALVNFIRKLKANFSQIHLAVTVQSEGKSIAFRDLIQDLNLNFGVLDTKNPLADFWKGTVVEDGKNDNLNCYFIQSKLKSGCSYYDIKNDTAYILLSEQDIIGSYLERSRYLASSKQRNINQTINSLLELTPNQLLVHQNYGICRYTGLKTTEINKGYPQDFLELEFADTNMLMTVHDLHLVSIYSHQINEDVQKEDLSYISGRKAKRWLKQKEKAMESIRDLAAKLIEAQALREMEKGFKFTIYDQEYQEFVSHFKYEETPDQYATIQSILEDMSSDRKMDRLICGDVGFGKTEIAMRAAFISIINTKQVAVIAPTTLLAQQHFESFRDRFAYCGANIALLSRFTKESDKTQILKQLERGQIDIIIGTHSLLQDKIKFKDLGLLIIDEEHRFGVRQKELIKEFKADIDVLNMTATPIPRTLNLALNGLRSISLIATPPANRISIRTKVINSADENAIKDAINREIMRGGQVFFLSNDVHSMPFTVKRLEELIPNARITFAHGQMTGNQLEEAMMGFYNQRYNILVCSTIIETGIDIPNANTIIINNAQNFGMAQLHQLRGRVGRSHRQAYAYLAVPNINLLSDNAQKRLQAMTEIDSLGAGYLLATHDLDIRGAGEILGKEQSGKVDTIGYSLYMSMLKNAVKALKAAKDLRVDELFDKRTEISLGIPITIPDFYISAPNVRVFYYSQISNASSELAIDEIANNMIERFGTLPPSLRALLMISKLRLRIQGLGIKRISANNTTINIEFEHFDDLNIEKAKDFIINKPNLFSFKDHSFLIHVKEENSFKKIKILAQILNQLLIFQEDQIFNKQVQSAFENSKVGTSIVSKEKAKGFASQINKEDPLVEENDLKIKETLQKVRQEQKKLSQDNHEGQDLTPKRKRGRPAKSSIISEVDETFNLRDKTKLLKGLNELEQGYIPQSTSSAAFNNLANTYAIEADTEEVKPRETKNKNANKLHKNEIYTGIVTQSKHSYQRAEDKRLTDLKKAPKINFDIDAELEKIKEEGIDNSQYSPKVEAPLSFEDFLSISVPKNAELIINLATIGHGKYQNKSPIIKDSYANLDLIALTQKLLNKKYKSSRLAEKDLRNYLSELEPQAIIRIFEGQIHYQKEMDNEIQIAKKYREFDNYSIADEHERNVQKAQALALEVKDRLEKSKNKNNK